MSRAPMPDPDLTAELLAAAGVDPDVRITPAGGASGGAWTVRTADGTTFLLRQARRVAAISACNLAMSSASHAGLPVQEVIGSVVGEAGGATLLTWLPGRTLFDAFKDAFVGGDADGRIAALGRAAGRMQRHLHEVPAPPGIPPAAGAPMIDGDPERFASAFDSDYGVEGLPVGEALIHLDWHPLNLLTSAAGDDTAPDGSITGVIDWQNARRGHRFLDLARTVSVLDDSPAVRALPAEQRAAAAVYLDGWADGYGPPARQIPDDFREWATRVRRIDQPS